MKTGRNHPLAIVGIGCRLPGSVDDVSSFWNLLTEGRTGIVEVPENRWNRDRLYHQDRSIPGHMVTKWGGFVDNLDQFDPHFWSISPREAVRMDPQQRWLLEVSWEALEDAGHAPSILRGTNTGVFVGIAGNDYAGLQMPYWEETDVHTNSGCTFSIAANRISYMFDFSGPSLCVDTACSSALVAVSQACNSIWTDKCDAAIAGGVNAIITPHATIGFSKASMLSPRGKCFAFDDRADGYVRGEGAAMVYIKRLDQALEDDDRIYAVIRAAVVNSDGHTSSMTVPSVEGQSAMLRQAYQDAGIEPSQVAYMEAHGTGTPVGDPIEARALGEVLSERRPMGQDCLVGSVKTNIGHLESGSGIAGLLKSALVLYNDQVPPNLNFENPNPNIPFKRLRLEVVKDLRPLPHFNGRPAVAGVNSFGFGGTNAHVVLEAAPAREKGKSLRTAPKALSNGAAKHRELAERPCLLPISARDDQALARYVQSYRDYLADTDEPLEDICYSAGERKEHHEHRLVATGTTTEEMRMCLANWIDDPQQCEGTVLGKASANAGGIVFVFTGQGAQTWDMGRRLFDREPIFRHCLQRIDKLLKPLAGWSLLEEMMGPCSEEDSRIHSTSIAQPGIFALQVGLAELWKSWGIEPTKVIGHSVGEVAAAYVAGVYSLEDAVKIIYHRSRLQDSAGGDGRMLAVGLSAADARALIGDDNDRIQLAVINSSNLVTLAGDREPMEEIAARLEDEGTFNRWLRINYAFHSHHMDPIKDELLEVLADIKPQPSRFPFISTVAATMLPGENLDAMYWWHNIRNPVLFGSALSNLVQTGERVFLELGPHPALESSINECLAEQNKRGEVFHSLKRKADDSQEMLDNLAALHANGTVIDWAAVNQSQRRFVRLPSYPWQYDRYWLEEPAAARHRLAGIPHKLLGERLTAAEPTWQFQLDPRLFTYLTDHRIWDSVIFPAAGFAEIGLALIQELYHDQPYVVEELQIKKALFMSVENVPTVQVVLDEKDKSYRVFSSVKGGDWELNAQGRLVAYETAKQPDDLDLDEARLPLTDTLDHDKYCKEMEEAGYQFGPNFQQIENMWRKHGEAIGEIVVPEGVLDTLDDYQFHPAVLDACFQTSKAVQVIDEEALFLPASIGRVHLYRPKSPRRIWAHAKLRHYDGDSIVTDIFVYNDEGQRVADVLAFRFDRVDQSRGNIEDLNDCFYRFEWQPARLHGSGLKGPCEFASAADIIAGVREGTPAIHEKYGLQEYQTFARRMDETALQFVQNACLELGWRWNVGDRLTLDDFVRELGVAVPRHLRLARVELQHMAAEGLLRQVGEDHWEVTKPLVTAKVDAEIETLSKAYPRFATELELQRVTGPYLAEVLSGRQDPIELLFPGGSADMLQSFYAEGIDFPAFNELIQLAVTQAIKSLPERRALRVLEVGAGTGSLTRAILPVLPADRSEYLFTDIGPAFLTAGRSQFAEYRFVDYQVFDLERPAAEQGIEPHSFDLILATNVLHATTDLKQTCANLQSCLDSGGMLMFLDVVRKRLMRDNIFGLLKGWWAFTDLELRQDSALLERSQWESLLTECGMQDVGSFSSSTGNQEAEQAVFVSLGPSVESESVETEATSVDKPAYLLFADDFGFADKLAEEIRASDGRAICVRVGTEYSRDGDDLFTIDPESEVDLQQLFSEIISPPHSIVHCWSIDRPDADSMDPPALCSAQQVGVLSLLRMAHVLSEQQWEQGPQICIVGRDINIVAPGDRSSGIASSVLTGFARVANNEYPKYRWKLVDLAREPSEHEAEDLYDELTLGGDELEIAFRSGRRFVHRVKRAQVDELPHRTTDGVTADGEVIPYRLETDNPGILTHLSLNETQRKEPGPGEIEIRVQAGGINFRDVMKALGMYPGNPIDLLWFGDDVSGVVERVGSGVHDLKVGDRVSGMAPYCFRAFCTVDCRMVFKTPDQISFEQAATLPTVFLTSHYALNHLARLQPGEKVLVHAGTGGVGQAAIQVAQHIGAEVFATAGTPEKRQMLRDMGVQHVMNSRTLEFADQTMEITGGQGVDVVLNSLAGEFIPKSFSVLAPFGRFLEIGKIDVYGNSTIGLEPLKNNISYFVIDLAQHLEKKPAYVASLFAELAERFFVGDYQPLPHTVFPINDVVEAFRYMAQGKHVGKNVLSFQVDQFKLGPCTNEEHLLRDEATYLITGGAGGFGLELAKWMTRHGARHLVLMSRSGPRNEEDRAGIEQMRNDGVEVVDARGDVTSLADVQCIVDQIQAEMPPLKGVVHGAMVLDDEFIAELDDERFNRVLNPKMLGAWNLHVTTQDLPLEHFVGFSSFSNLIGAPKQSNYNAGNSFLDTLAHARRAQGLCGLTYNWGALVGAGFVQRNEKTAQYLDKLGMQAFSIDEALRVFGHMLLWEPVQLGAARMNWSNVTRLSPLVAHSNMYAELADEGSNVAGGSSVRARIAAAAPDQRMLLVEEFVATQVGNVFGVEAGKVDRETPLTSLGLDSLMSIDLLNRVEGEIGMRLPMGAIMKGPNVKELAETLLGLLGDFASDSSGESAALGGDVTSLVPLEKAAGTDGGFPLTEGQQALWFLYRMAPNSSAYNLTFCAQFTPHIDVERMKQAFASLYEQHPMLDVTFSDDSGIPLQRLRRGGTINFREHDVTELDKDEIKQLLVKHANQPFDLEEGPVVRLELFRTAEGHVALLCMHHIISDAWSVIVLIRDLIESYFSLGAGRQPQYTPQPFSYEDFVGWEQKHLESEAATRIAQYWQKHLEGAPMTITLPTDHPRPPVQSFRGGTLGFQLDEDLTHDVVRVAAEQNVTLFTLLLSAYEVLLHRYTKQQDFLVGCPLAGRNHGELQNTVGYFVNPVPLRSRVDDDPTLLDFLDRNSGHVAGALDNQQYPLKRLVQELDVPRDASRSPLFQVAFSMERIPGFDEQGIAVFLVGQGGYKFHLGDLQIETVDLTLRQAQFEILLVVEEAGGNIYGCWQYNRDLFEPETIERLNAWYAKTLQQIVKNPSKRISQFEIFDDEEPSDEARARQSEWNRTETAQQYDLPVHRSIETQALRTPDEVAVVCGNDKLTYSELNERSNRLAHFLRSVGVGADDRVGVCMKRGVDLIVTIQAVLKAGGAYVPLDPTYPQRRLERIAQSAGMSVVVTHDEHKDRLGEGCGQLVCLDSQQADIAEQSADLPAPLENQSELIYVIFTSGSTGEPKGAGVYHRGFTNLIDWFVRDFEITAADRTLVITSHGFDLTQKNLYAPLLVGGQVHLSACHKFDPERILNEIEDKKITLLNCTPSMFYALVDDPSPERLGKLKSLRTVFLGGEPINIARLSAWRSQEGFATELVNTYGPTECTDICSSYRLAADSNEVEIPIGFPVYNVQTYVLDDNGAPLPVGDKGELYIGGAGVGAGYINDLDKLADSFITDPFASEPGARMYRTGDLCRYREDGAIEFVGRVDDQIKIRGFRVELGEIEATLCEHPNVTEVVVTAREDKLNNKRLVAYPVLDETSDNVATQFKEFLQERLPEHMVPSIFVPLDKLPVTPHGKVDRLALPAPSELAEQLAASTRYVAPRDQLETRLTAIWSEVLGVERIGVLDSFFDHGGDSLMTVQLTSILRRQFDMEVPIAVFLRDDTVASIASYLRQRKPAQWSPLVPIQPHGDRPPLFCIHPIGGNVMCYSELSSSLGEDQPVFGIQARGVDGSRDPSSSVAEMVEEYLAAVREVRSSGPYHLAAWSSGGVIAYEMARQLKKSGAEMGSIFLFDSLAPAMLDIDVNDEARILTELAGFLNRFYHLGIEVTYDELSMLGPDQRIALMLQRTRQTNFLLADLDEEYVRRFLGMCQANLRAVDAYQAEPDDLPVTLYRAKLANSLDNGHGKMPAELGWRKLLGDNLRVQHVDGDHVSMLTGDHVRQLGQQVRRDMTRSQGSLLI